MSFYVPAVKYWGWVDGGLDCYGWPVRVVNGERRCARWDCPNPDYHELGCCSRECAARRSAKQEGDRSGK